MKKNSANLSIGSFLIQKFTALQSAQDEFGISFGIDKIRN